MLRARMAKEAGCSGVVCSGLEVERVKAELGKDFIVVTPGIRPAWSLAGKDDQKRIITPYQAIKGGADYLVVGRPIRAAEKPIEAAERVLDEIEMALSE
jgi:orotidine-5'-phosphate decarboxylase